MSLPELVTCSRPFVVPSDRVSVSVLLVDSVAQRGRPVDPAGFKWRVRFSFPNEGDRNEYVHKYVDDQNVNNNNDYHRPVEDWTVMPVLTEHRGIGACV